MLNKTSLKFIAAFVVIIAISLTSLYFLQTYFSPGRQAERRYAELQKQTAEDTYGGKTPEETLKLFVDALKAGDLELASKYFIIERQEESLRFFEQVRAAGNLDALAVALSFPYKKQAVGTQNAHYILDIYNTKEKSHIQLSVVSALHALWKIESMSSGS